MTGSPKCTSRCGIFCTSRENPVALLITDCQSLHTDDFARPIGGIVPGLVIATRSGQVVSIQCFEPSSLRSC